MKECVRLLPLPLRLLPFIVLLAASVNLIVMIAATSEPVVTPAPSVTTVLDVPAPSPSPRTLLPSPRTVPTFTIEQG